MKKRVMQPYFATFITGCHDIVHSRLQRFASSELVVREVHDGLVIFDAALSQNQLSELRFLKNVYGLIADLGPQPSIDAAAKAAANTNISLPKNRFTVRVRVANQPVGLAALNHLQTAVAQKTGGQPDAFKPELELLLWLRTDGRALWGWQLPKAGFKMRRLEPGELRPELTHCMGLLAGLDTKHTVLDPFAGYGAVVRECLQGFHCQQVIAVEHNEHLVPHLKSIPRLVAMQGDAARLPHIQTRSVDRVITDPPWGKFEGTAPQHLQHVYYESLVQIHRVLRTKGCAVILTAAPFLPELAAQIGFTIEKHYAILVNGQKATLYKLRKMS